MAEVSIPSESLRLVESPHPCSYIETERAALEYRVFPSLQPAELEELIRRGWRRFGPHVFRPRCAACTQCVPIRIDVAGFSPSKSQRKIRRRNRHIAVSLKRATVTADHVRLYNSWHKDMTGRRGWRLQRSTPSDYAEGFLLGQFPSAHELRYFDGDDLVGVGLIDMLPESISSAYFFHAPEWRPLGPGTFSLLCEIDLARARGLRHVYLGYWIAACPSMSYKNRFSPHEFLVGRPEDTERPCWECRGERRGEEGKVEGSGER